VPLGSGAADMAALYLVWQGDPLDRSIMRRG